MAAPKHQYDDLPVICDQVKHDLDHALGHLDEMKMKKSSEKVTKQIETLRKMVQDVRARCFFMDADSLPDKK